MVGKNNHSKMIQANLKQHYKAYKVGRQWVFASLASLSLGAALFLGSTTTSYAETVDADTTPDTQSDRVASSAVSASTAKAVVLTPANESSNNAETKSDAVNSNVTASDDSSSNSPVADAKQVDAKGTTNSVTANKTPVSAPNQDAKLSVSKAGNDGLTGATTGAEPTTDVKASTAHDNSVDQPSAKSTESKTQTDATKANTDQIDLSKKTMPTGQVTAAKITELQAQLKTLLVDPSAVDISDAKTVASELYALTGQPQQFAAVAGDVQSAVLLRTSTNKIGYGQPKGDVTITAKIFR